MNKYQARWNNAVRMAEKINRLLDAGYMVFDDGEHIEYRFIITNDEVILKISETSSIMYFIKDPELDNGMYTSIPEYNAQFKDWKYVAPKNIKSVFRQVKNKLVCSKMETTTN